MFDTMLHQTVLLAYRNVWHNAAPTVLLAYRIVWHNAAPTVLLAYRNVWHNAAPTVLLEYLNVWHNCRALYCINIFVSCAVTGGNVLWILTLILPTWRIR